MASRVQPNLNNLLNFDHLEKPVVSHLQKVYGTLSIAMLAAAAGAYVHLFTGLFQAGLLSFFASIGLLLLTLFTPHSAENQGKRVAYMTGFAFFTGIGLGPALDMAIRIDPSIVPTAFLGTALIFISFTMSALLSKNRTWIYLGGFLMSGMSLMMLLSLSAMLFGSKLLFEVNLYLGLAIMCGFILYDTQLIVEKKRRGDDDYIWHCVDLFIDFVGLFRRLLIILSNKENKKKNN